MISLCVAGKCAIIIYDAVRCWNKIYQYDRINKIVPYTIAKILISIPKGYTLNWKDIWDKQRLSPAFIREIEIVTRMTNDFICDSHGVIVTEYCKRQPTWEEYRDKVKYELSRDFLAELIPESLLKEVEKDAKKDQKETNDLQTIMDMITKGAGYWNSMLMKGSSSLSYQEKNAVVQIIDVLSIRMEQRRKSR